MGEQGENLNNQMEFEVDMNSLTNQMLSAMLTKLAVISALPEIAGNNSLVLRIQSEFAALKAIFLEAVKPPPEVVAGAAVVGVASGPVAGEVPGQEEVFPEPVPLVSPAVEMELRINREMYKLRKENRILNRKNERNIIRKKELERLKSPLHKKLHNCYAAVKHLLEDVREEALVGAPSEWELLGEHTAGFWEHQQCSFNLHNIIKIVKAMAE